MKKNKRLGDDPTEARKEKISQAIGISKNRDIGISQKRKEPERIRVIRKKIERGETSTYYINKKTKTIMQRTLIHLPLTLVEKLKKEGYDSIPRKSLSEVIREKLQSQKDIVKS